MTPAEELVRLRQVGTADELPGSTGLLRYVVRAEDPAAVIRRATDVLRVVLERSDQPWPSLDAWRRALPAWFVAGCAPGTTAQEQDAWVARWRALDPVARASAEAERGWTLEAWLSWLEPAQRSWFWWGAELRGDRVEVLIDVDSWPYPDGALRWLLHVAGASTVDAP
jgi:hypothetical protein